MAIARLQVTMSPLHSKFKLVSSTCRSIMSIFVLALGISVSFTFAYIYSSDSILPTALCNIFYNPLGCKIKHFSALFLAILQFATCFAVTFMYFLLYWNSTSSLEVHSSKSRIVSLRRIMIQIILITGTNIISWVPSATIYIASIFIKCFPTDVLLYTTIFITPLNSMFNSIFIAIVNRKSSKDPSNSLNVT